MTHISSILLAACMISCAFVQNMITVAAPVGLKDELLANFKPQLNERSLNEVSNLLARIRDAAQVKFYGRKSTTTKKFPEVVPTESNIDFNRSNFTTSESIYLFEEDIVLLPAQARRIFSELGDETMNVKQKRAVISKAMSTRWRKFPINYVKDGSYTQKEMNVINQAIKFWSENTCLNFSRLHGSRSGDYLRFFPGHGESLLSGNIFKTSSNTQKCYSMVGHQGGRQSISLGEGCVQLGVVTHEVGHAMGLWHEQSRPDSDNYIRVLSDNIISGLLGNFLQKTWSDVTAFSVPYDFGSVMHYGSTAFSYSYHVKTIETVLPGYQRTIGQREQPSFYDVEVMNEAYCSGRCLSRSLCHYGGYAHPKNCSRCICPAGTDGQYCETVEKSKNAKCGGILHVDGYKWQVITSPDYPSPGYKKNQSCSWIIKAAPGKKVILEFLGEFKLSCYGVCLDYVEVKNSSYFGNTGMRYCCSPAPHEPIFSVTNEMMVIFRATYGYNIGFQARIQQYPAEFKPQTTEEPISTEIPETLEYTEPSLATDYIPEVTDYVIPDSESDLSVHLNNRNSAVQTNIGESWGEWSLWSACTKSCGGCGVRRRTRICFTKFCSGAEHEYEKCGFDVCPSETLCSLLQSVDQKCQHEDGVCTEFRELKVICASPRCCEPFKVVHNQCRASANDAIVFDSNNDAWGSWSAWGDCVGLNCCGCGIQIRNRPCLSDTCSGPRVDYKRCNSEPCPLCSNTSHNSSQTVMWTVGHCLGDSLDLCVMPTRQIDLVCPCCWPLVLKNGLCVSSKGPDNH